MERAGDVERGEEAAAARGHEQGARVWDRIGHLVGDLVQRPQIPGEAPAARRLRHRSDRDVVAADLRLRHRLRDAALVALLQHALEDCAHRRREWPLALVDDWLVRDAERRRASQHGARPPPGREDLAVLLQQAPHLAAAALREAGPNLRLRDLGKEVLVADLARVSVAGRRGQLGGELERGLRQLGRRLDGLAEWFVVVVGWRRSRRCCRSGGGGGRWCWLGGRRDRMHLRWVGLLALEADQCGAVFGGHSGGGGG